MWLEELAFGGSCAFCFLRDGRKARGVHRAEPSAVQTSDYKSTRPTGKRVNQAGDPRAFLTLAVTNSRRGGTDGPALGAP